MKINEYFLKYQLLLLFIAVFIFRSFYASNIVVFTQDQARDAWKMEQFKEDGKFFIEYGPKASVSNFYLAPFYYQLHYWASLITNNNPLTMHWIVVFVESLTPVLLFLISKRFIRKKYAYVISLLYALSPLVTFYSTFSWNPNMIPFLSLLSLFLAIKYFETEKSVYIIFFSLSLSVAVHLHYQAIVLLPFYIFVFIKSILKNRKSLKFWLFGFLLSLIILIPYFVAEIKNEWINTSAITNYFKDDHSRYFDRVSKPEFIFSFIPNLFDRIFLGKNYKFMHILLGRIVFLFGFLFFIFRSIYNKKLRLILIYFLGILVMLRVYKGDKIDYYMSSLFTFPYFLIGLMLEKFKIKILPYILTILLSVSAAYYYHNIETKNELKDLKNAVFFLNDNIEEKNVSFHLHNDDYVNVFSYAINRYSDIDQDKNSLVIIDICYKNQLCDLKERLVCKYDRGYTHMSLFREISSYELIRSNNDSGGYKVRIGQVKNLPKIDYLVSTYSNEYGNDFLESGW